MRYTFRENPVYKKKISVYEMVKSFSYSMDLISKAIVGHHNRVAYISLEIGREMGLNETRLKKLVISALIHDLGIFYIQKFTDSITEGNYEDSFYDLNCINTLLDLDFNHNEVNSHAEIGYHLFKNNSPIADIPEIIRYHHHNWNEKNNDEIFILSNVLYLADRIAVLIEKEPPILSQRQRVKKIIKNKQEKHFLSEAVDSFINLSIQDYFWFNIINYKEIKKILDDLFRPPLKVINYKEMLKYSKFIGHIVDSRSSFTAAHSEGVAGIASHLSKYVKFSKKKQKKIEIAGYLHDIGKLIVPPKILNKADSLTKEEWSIMKSHVYYTYHALSTSKNLKEIREWAAFHHERLDGKGYPFHMNGSQLSLGSRIMGVADVFTAITEERPYRNKIENLNAIKILIEMAENNELDRELISIVLDNFNEFNKIREEIQIRSKDRFIKFNNKAKEIINSGI